MSCINNVVCYSSITTDISLTINLNINLKNDSIHVVESYATINYEDEQVFITDEIHTSKFKVYIE